MLTLIHLDRRNDVVIIRNSAFGAIYPPRFRYFNEYVLTVNNEKHANGNECK